MKDKIERLELTNYRLYVFISLLVGVVAFIVSFFVTSRVMFNMDKVELNQADQVMRVTDVSDIGFDLEITSKEPIKVKYYFGKSPETLILFFESKDFITEETQQFRGIVPDTTSFVQIEIEYQNGEKVKSQIRNVNDMLK